MSRLHILSGGAAQGLVGRIAPTFRAQTGTTIEGEYGAVGVMADKLRGGTTADVVILTAALVRQLAEDGLVDTDSIADIGRVETALAVRSDDRKVSAQDETELRRILLASDAIFVPDLRASTAGIHVAKVLRELSIMEEIAARLQIFPNGNAAMQALAKSAAHRPIGCTQATEIIATHGVTLSGVLPEACGLATMYTAGVTARSTSQAVAQELIGLLTSTESRQTRRDLGFVE